jgi:tetratricopeptide (TPR) repeat protein
MSKNIAHPPRHYLGVMVSSTFTDLKNHRAAMIRAIKANGLTEVAMENDAAKPIGVVESSLQMVRDGSACVLVISKKYGQIPECADNPKNVSITELEFDEAMLLNRPILLFIMGDGHPLREADIELDADKRAKLNAFRERAKRMAHDTPVHRVYVTFDSLEDFTEKAAHSVAELRRYLDQQAKSFPPPSEDNPIPQPPEFYAEPVYLGSHDFVGRRSELETLSDWASPADSHPVLLFEAIGGAGKSMLTWEWTTKHATQVRADWAGRFWYSFYEKGAIMADFCRRALSYITQQPLEDYRKKKTPELSELLLHHLQARPWLLVLDGLERVLVAYHRFDAAQVADEEAGKTDEIAHRDPCAVIRPEDDDLLRALAAASRSKILTTSRLIPRVLLNPASQPIPGVLRVPLPGLRPADAEELIRACGVTGDSRGIQDFLKSHCDCHPLVTGVIAGLVTDYFPDRGNFDAWAADPKHGGLLNLANLDLVQKRNHILKAALAAVPEKGRQLLSIMALLSEAADYRTLMALNPHLPPKPGQVAIPENPERGRRWKRMNEQQRAEAQEEYEVMLRRRDEYEQAVTARERSAEFLAAPDELAKTVRDLERRGLLQYDANAKRYDLHPVVRGVAVGGLTLEDKYEYGQRVVDHFSQQAHRPYDDAESLDDVRDGIRVVRTLLQMGRLEQALSVYRSDLSNALVFNLEANAEVLSLIRPFFPLPDGTVPRDGSWLANELGLALSRVGETEEALVRFNTALLLDLREEDWPNVLADLSNISVALGNQNCVAERCLCSEVALSIAGFAGDTASLFRTRLDSFDALALIGQWQRAEAVWELLNPMGRDWDRAIYRPGDAEWCNAAFHFQHEDMTEEHLGQAESLAKAGKNRTAVRDVHALRGLWHLEHQRWALAAESFHEAVRMAREVGQSNASSETGLALAKFHLGQIANPRHEAEQLASAKDPNSRLLAELWLAIGDPELARKHALAAYKWAWADGEPYVNRYELNKTTALLQRLGVEVPTLPPYDPAKDKKLPWEDEVRAAIEKLRREKESKD